MKNLSVKKQYIIINAIMCLVVAVIAIACITFTSMPTRSTTATTSDNDIPLSDTSYNSKGVLCGKNLFNINNILTPPNINSITVKDNLVFMSNCLIYSSNKTPRFKHLLKPLTVYAISFSAKLINTIPISDPGYINASLSLGFAINDEIDYRYFGNTCRLEREFHSFTFPFETFASNFEYLCFALSSLTNIKDNNISIVFSDLQIEESRSSTAYEPYFEFSQPQTSSKFNYSYFNRNLKDTCIIGGFVYSKNFEYILTLPNNFMSGINTTDSLMLALLSKDGTYIDRDIISTGCGVSQSFSVKDQPELATGRVIILYYNSYIGGNTSFTVDNCKGVELNSTYLGNIDGVYDQVYKEGHDIGWSEGHGDGYTAGRKFGHDEGYTKGMNDGSSTWDNLFPSIFGAIGGFFKNMLDINVLGMNLLSILGGVGAIIISLVLIRMVVK